jgi:hypothetical protein
MNYNKIEIRNLPGNENEVSTFGNTQILIDGVPLVGVLDMTLRMQHGDVAKVELELIGKVVVNLAGKYEFQLGR